MSGYTVIVAGSVADALLCFEPTGGSIDLLITDLVLDDGPDGIELALAIRSRCAGQPVLLITGYSDGLPGDRRLHGVDVLGMAFGHSVLLQAINKATCAVGGNTRGCSCAVTRTASRLQSRVPGPEA